MRLLAVGLAVAVIVFVATAGHVVFLPLVFLPLGLFLPRPQAAPLGVACFPPPLTLA